MSEEKDKIRIEGGLIVFNDLETLITFGKGVRESVWEPKRKAMSEHLALHPELPAKLKEIWYEIRNRDYGAWGLLQTEHVRLFATEAEKLLGEHDWIVPCNYFSGMDLMEVCAGILQDEDWEQGGK